MLIVPFILFNLGISHARQEATTSDGRKILIYPDGTLKPVKIESLTEIHPISISNLVLPGPNPFDLIIKHTGYTLSFNKTCQIADWVAYELTAEETV